MKYEEIKASLKKQIASKNNIPQTFEVKQTKTTIKEYNANDLPCYFKWDLGSQPWYFRVRMRQGKIVTDLLKPVLEGYELTYSTLSSAFDPSNKPVTEDEWRNKMHVFIKEMQ